jgi:hypothetical protein
MNNNEKLEKCINSFSNTYYNLLRNLFKDLPEDAIDFVSDEADKVIRKELEIFKDDGDVELLYQVLVKENIEGITKDFSKKIHTISDNMEKSLEIVMEENEEYLGKLLSDEGTVH